MNARAALEREWLELTRRTLPGVAAERGWPVRADHCFQRILLDAAAGGVWYDAIAGRPAYRYAADGVLRTAVELARAMLAGQADINALNRQSLEWRRQRGRQAQETSMKISARNQLPGTITAITPGAVNGTVKVDIGGHVVTSSITEEAIADLGLAVGDSVTVIVKASDVLIGK